jgi:hypothetical protein
MSYPPQPGRPGPTGPYPAGFPNQWQPGGYPPQGPQQYPQPGPAWGGQPGGYPPPPGGEPPRKTTRLVVAIVASLLVLGGGITAGILLTSGGGDRGNLGGTRAQETVAAPTQDDHAASNCGSPTSSPTPSPSSDGQTEFGQPTPEKLQQTMIELFRCGNAQLLSQIVCGKPSAQDLQEAQQQLDALPKNVTYSAAANSPETESVYFTGTITLESSSESAKPSKFGQWNIMQVGTNWCVMV